ncbi:CPBP family intramembrane glutamic endopeptidase [Amycolatopsis sp. FDAARGOS 1241]|uniref:CPBP family intramembrane glutamic endopeptidase n=1 Tax=Amycolatopsis sp. FDAARGOS 1241 TaxID=2778070 RepID=UPI00194E3276|nr:CPBP family intramembrane glutamic endopeptidase [Amycolatopsis sp. FDAARGOS 1241]QRP49976.1 CPBP family intramembrane metalloprotease [Amycolatopsis sp. FDAARGOS 1241]
MRRRLLAAVTATGTGLLGWSLSTEPGSRRFPVLTGAVAATWFAGGFAAGPPPRGRSRHPVAGPVALAAGAFGVFYGCALLARRIPTLSRALSGVLAYAHRGCGPAVYAAALVTGAAEEVFFRGVLQGSVTRAPVTTSTAVYALSTVATRNPALVLASIGMGTLFGLQRRATGGIQAPLLTHLVWSALMLTALQALFETPAAPG